MGLDAFRAILQPILDEADVPAVLAALDQP
jgi:hypothetical protein